MFEFGVQIASACVQIVLMLSVLLVWLNAGCERSYWKRDLRFRILFAVPEALKAKVAEAMEVLRNVAQQWWFGGHGGGEH